MILKKTRTAKILAFAMAFALSVSFFLADFTSVKQSAQASVLYTPNVRDVTGEVDLSGLREASFNDKALSAPKKANEDKWVIVGLSGKSMLESMDEHGYGSLDEFSASTVGKLTASDIASEQKRFLNRLTYDGIQYEYKYSYSTVDNAVAIKVNSAYIERLEGMVTVDTVVVSNTYLYPETTTATGDNAVHNDTFVYETGIYNSSEIISEYGYSGDGMVVAVLDTGLDYTHSAFQTLPDDLDKVAITEEDVQGFLNPADEKNTLMAVKRAAAKGNTLTYRDLYLSAKVPFAFDYADDDTDVYNTYSSHGTHVSGIVGGIDDHYTDKDGNYVDKQFIGVAPNAQIVSCKVFTDDLDDEILGGAETYDILAALEDCVILGVDVINMSLGSSSGFTETQGDEEGDYIDEVYTKIQDAGISLICAASNDYSSGYGGPFGTNLASNPDAGTVGAPSTYGAALSVASINGQNSDYLVGNKSLDGTHGGVAVFYEEANDENGLPYDFAEGMLAIAKKLNSDDNPNNDIKDYTETTATFEYVVVGGVGKAADYTGTVSRLLDDKDNPRIALISRGDNTFKEKVEIAMQMGAIGVIIYNNVAGKIRMSLGEIEDPCPAVSVNLEAGTSLVLGAGDTKDKSRYIGEITIDTSLSAGPFMSDFSSWGPTPDLKLKPEITAHGGEITSAVPGGYDEQSGTSMAAPNMAGAMAIIRQYVKEEFNLGDSIADKREITKLCNQLAMSNTTIAYDPEGLPYSPRKQGSGLANLSNIIKSNAYITVEGTDKTKLEYGDDKNRTGEYTFEFTVVNKGKEALSFNPTSIVMTETLSIDGLAVAEKAHLFEDCTTTYTVNGVAHSGAISINAGASAVIGAKIVLTEEEKKYIDDRFENGMYVEGFFKLVSADAEKQNDISVPFLAFYGDWTDGNLLDYSVYELAEIEKDTSKTEEEKEKESVFATSPYTSYHDDYILPMGTFIYALPDDADPVYAEEKFAAVSGYNLYYGENENGNYRTTWELRMLYAGLLRNAKRVDYTLTNMDTGELLLEDSAHRVSKAHSGGGSTRPGFVELEIEPKEYGFRNNTQYQMSFDFDFEYVDVSGEKTVKSDNFTFSFYADYDAPVLTDSSVRYYYYKDGKTTKRKVFLDLDVYDNHYAQSVLLCYTDEEDNYLKLVNDYVTPVRQKNINGTTTVSIEITDIYERFDGELFVQIDDYAMNYKVYGLNFDDMKQKRMPAELSVDPAEENVTVAINEMKKVTPVYTSPADIADFVWTSADESVAIVKNGEIVGVAPGETTVTVSTVVPVDEEGNPTAEPLTATYNVKVTDSRIELSYPAMNFGIIRNSKDSYVKAEGLVEVHPNEQFQLKLEYDPWYYPTENLTIEWSTSNDKVATIDQEGNVHTLKKGTAIINAVIKGTSYSTGVTLKVGEEFIVSNYRLIDYHGTGGKVYIPTDMNIFYIETDAFKDNDNITEIVINKTVMEIREQAFRGCTALKRVSFVESEPMDVADADLNMIFDEAFINCTALEEVDFSNTKTILVGRRVFKNCTSLNSLGVDKNGVSGATKLGTVSAEAFEGCTSLEEIDITRFNMSGKNVFKGCTSLKTVKTADFTSIGNGMFEGCTSLESIEINTAKVGANAFEGCENLASVTFNANGLNLGASAFEGCGSLASVTFNGTVNSIGDRAFAGTALTEAVIPAGLTSIGERLFDGASITKAVIKKGVDIESIYALGSPFAGLTLSEIAVEDNEKYATVDGVVYNSSKTEIILVPNGIASFNVPETVTSIAANAFYGNMNVVGVSKNGITFKSGAVEEFTVSSIGAYAFAASTVETADLTNVIFGDGAFSECWALATVTVNCAVIPAHAFERTEALTTLNTTSDLVQICDYAFANTALKSIDLSAAIVDDNAFAFSKVESVVLKNATTVGISAFEGSAVKSVELGAVNYMGSRAFANCNSLATVTLAEGSTMIADSAFYKEEESKVLTTVNVPETLTFVGAYAFYNNAGLKSFVAEGLTYVGNFAFTYANALKTFAFDNVTYVGDYAFTGARVDVSKDLFEREFSWMAADIEYAADFTKLNLAKVTHIGQYAFAGVPATEIKAPVVEHIGEQAFYATEMTTFNIPATVEFIGEGAFAATFNATEFTSDNATYVSEEGVIYRIMDNGKLELFAYPAARKAERDPNMMSYRYYAVKEGTVRIAEYAGSFIQAGAMHEIIFPYTLKTIGSYAFFNSAIETYTFESVNAPVLEAIPTDDIYVYLSQMFGNFRGMFYTNFKTFFCYLFPYEYMGVESGGIGIEYQYPENGVGYDNYVYSAYFDKGIKSNPVMDDYTREAKAKIDALYTAEEIEQWVNLEVTAENKQMVVDFGEAVKEARVYYNNVADPVQQSFLTAGSGEKISALETSLRAVKAHFGIEVKIKGLTYDSDYKKEYFAGETFDLGSLVVIIEYDDGSTEVADPAGLTLVTGVLDTYTRAVSINGNYGGSVYTLRVTVNVTEKPQSPEDSSSSSSSSSEQDSTGSSQSSSTQISSSDGQSGGNVGLIVGISAGAVAVIAAAVVIIFIKKRK